VVEALEYLPEGTSSDLRHDFIAEANVISDNRFVKALVCAITFGAASEGFRELELLFGLLRANEEDLLVLKDFLPLLWGEECTIGFQRIMGAELEGMGVLLG